MLRRNPWLTAFAAFRNRALRGAPPALATLRLAARGSELVARAVAEPSDRPARSYELANKPARTKPAGGDDKPRKPKREVTVEFEDIAVGKSFQGVVVRARRGGARGTMARNAFRPPPAAAPRRPPATGRRRQRAHAPAPARRPGQTSVATYGAFINIGASTDGLAHISKLSVRVPRRAPRPPGGAVADAPPCPRVPRAPHLLRRPSLWRTCRRC